MPTVFFLPFAPRAHAPTLVFSVRNWVTAVTAALDQVPGAQV